MSEEIAISMDFYSDWVDLLRDSLERMGYSIDRAQDPSKICCTYFNAARRRIAPRPRRILISREFSCPLAYLSGLQLLEDKVRGGQDLTPHLSRKILESDFDDPILNDWGIQHFHLGRTHDKRGLTRGTPYILLARVTNDEFYMIDVVGHDLWHHRRYVDILHSNWPRSIEPWKCSGALGLSDAPSDEAVKMLRTGHVNYMVQTEDGTIYCPIGGGYANSGISLEASRQCASAERLMENMENLVKEHGKEILRRARRDESTTFSSFHFRLVLRHDGAYAVDEQERIAFRLTDQARCSILYGQPSLPLRLCKEDWAVQLHNGIGTDPSM